MFSRQFSFLFFSFFLLLLLLLLLHLAAAHLLFQRMSIILSENVDLGDLDSLFWKILPKAFLTDFYYRRSEIVYAKVRLQPTVSFCITAGSIEIILHFLERPMSAICPHTLGPSLPRLYSKLWNVDVLPQLSYPVHFVNLKNKKKYAKKHGI